MGLEIDGMTGQWVVTPDPEPEKPDKLLEAMNGLRDALLAQDPSPPPPPPPPEPPRRVVKRIVRDEDGLIEKIIEEEDV